MDDRWFENQAARVKAIAAAIAACGCKQICEPCLDRAKDIFTLTLEKFDRQNADASMKSKPEL